MLDGCRSEVYRQTGQPDRAAKDAIAAWSMGTGRGRGLRGLGSANPSHRPVQASSSWPRFWSIDFGFTNPFVWQLWAKDPDGRLYLIRQIYHTKRLVEEHAARIKELALEELSDQDRWSAGPGNLGRHRPQCVLCDHDAEGRATLAKYLQVATMPARRKSSLASRR